MFEIFDKLVGLGFGNETIEKMDVKVYDNKTNEVVVSMEKPKIDVNGYLMNRNFKCPICFDEFKSSYIRSSKIRLIRMDTDLKPIYEPVDPLYYDATVCPSCGYSALGSLFNSVTDKQAELIKSQISKRYKKKTYPFVYSISDAIERYQMALLCSIVRKSKDGDRAFICLKLSWIYRDANDSQKEELLQKNALAGFLSAYEKETFPICGMDEPTLAYVIGELYRRLGNYDKASYFISRVLSVRDLNKRLAERARDIAILIREHKNSTQ